MENLTNEQIVDIINFYKLCGISEDMYLSRDGVLDLFTLLGIKPEFDENGNRLLTVYEQLAIAPKFENGKEVPIVFAIKHKASKIRKAPIDNCTEFTYKGEKENLNDKTIINKLKEDYFSAISNGNMLEATRIYDLIDLMTGGKADYYIGVQYNLVKFYKKMQQQLLIDMFANFVILLVLSKKQMITEGIVKFDKLYKAFLEKELKNSGLGAVNGKSLIPEISSMKITIGDDIKIENSNVKMSSKSDLKNLEEKTKKAEEQNQQSLMSFVKSKVSEKINKFKENLTKSRLEKEPEQRLARKEKNSLKSEKTLNILEND